MQDSNEFRAFDKGLKFGVIGGAVTVLSLIGGIYAIVHLLFRP